MEANTFNEQEVSKTYDAILNIIAKYRSIDIASDSLCQNYYNDDDIIPLLSRLISLLKENKPKLDEVLSSLSLYLMELIAPRVLIKIDKSYFNSEGLFHDSIKKRIGSLVDNRDSILSRYVSISTIYHYDRLIELSKHFYPEYTYTIAKSLCLIAANNSDYDDLVLHFAFEAVNASKNQNREYMRLCDIYLSYLFDLDDPDIIKRSIDYLVKINNTGLTDFYISLAYFRYYMLEGIDSNLKHLEKLNDRLYRLLMETRDMRNDSNLFMIYLYNRLELEIYLDNKKNIFDCYQKSYFICEKYLNFKNIDIHTNIIDLVIDYYKKDYPYLAKLIDHKVELNSNIRGSIKAELNSEFYTGKIDLVCDGVEFSMMVSDYYSAFHHKYIFLALEYNGYYLAPILFESITLDGNIILKLVKDKKIIIDAHENVMREGK